MPRTPTRPAFGISDVCAARVLYFEVYIFLIIFCCTSAVNFFSSSFLETQKTRARRKNPTVFSRVLIVCDKYRSQATRLSGLLAEVWTTLADTSAVESEKPQVLLFPDCQAVAEARGLQNLYEHLEVCISRRRAVPYKNKHMIQCFICVSCVPVVFQTAVFAKKAV